MGTGRFPYPTDCNAKRAGSRRDKIKALCGRGRLVLCRRNKLFCIRKKSEPDTPYYTLELGKNDRLVQCRGYRNDIENGYKMQKEVEKFVEQWMSKVVNPKKKKKERIKVNAA